MNFAARHIGPSAAEQDHMLAAIGYGSLDALTSAALPPGLAARPRAGLPAPLAEDEPRSPSCADLPPRTIRSPR